MPVDVYKFFADTGMSTYNLVASLGAFLFAIGVILTLINAAASYNGGAEAGHDPWGGSTLEWFALSPPPPHNFDLVPDVRSEEPYRDIREAVAARATELELPAAAPGGTTPEPEPAAASVTADDPGGTSEPDGDSDAQAGETADADDSADGSVA
jgi:heme/copper-type cytochrome/quinol oxidase subunit 1